MEYAFHYAIGIVSHTPIWVWLVLAGLIYLGLQRTKTRELSATRIIVPAAIFGLVAISRLALGHFAQPALLGTLAGLVLAFGLFMLVKPGRRARRTEVGTVLIEGEWFSLGLILAIFWVNYGVAVLTAIEPALADSDNLRFLYGFVNATSAGFMICRAIAYLKAETI
ncbi:hypothetical protein SAMN05421890_2218 [Ensifer adhaerens]|nr:hypothetical protein SAMN05421890_2218 [Ensifer adhaerens]HZG29523.1 DUF6622 family protein [Ensifer sp.]